MFLTVALPPRAHKPPNDPRVSTIGSELFESEHQVSVLEAIGTIETYCRDSVLATAITSWRSGLAHLTNKTYHLVCNFVSLISGVSKK